MASLTSTRESNARLTAAHQTADAETSLGETPAGAKRFAIALAAAFFALGLFNIFLHEPWRDELQAWLIARDSPTLAALFHNLRYDGHPAVWYLLLYAVTRFTSNPFAMQLLHVCIATASAYLFARFAPFTRRERALFSFGYFLAYEYSVVSRNYAAGVVCLFAFCAAHRSDERRNYLVLALLLGLLANTSAYGLMLACALALLLAYELWRERCAQSAGAAARGAQGSQVWLGAVVFVALSALSVWVMLPPADSGNIIGWKFDLSLEAVEKTLSVVERAFVPVPAYYFYDHWNTNLLRPGPVAALISCALLFVTALMLARRRAALLAYASGTGAMLLFLHMKYYGSMRHHGHVYLLFVACLWLAARLPEQSLRPARADRAARFLYAHRRVLLIPLLLVHAGVAVGFMAVDWRLPFSRSRDAAEYFRQQNLARYYAVADRDATVSPLTAYLRRPFHYVRGDREGTFVVWDKTWGDWPLIDPWRADLPGAARRKAAERREDILAVSTYELYASDAELVGKLTGSLVGDEDFYFYLFRYKPPLGAGAKPGPDR